MKRSRHSDYVNGDVGKQVTNRQFTAVFSPVIAF